jgi:hypothetical protein
LSQIRVPLRTFESAGAGFSYLSESPMYLNSEVIEKLQSAQWLISASLTEFGQLAGI